MTNARLRYLIATYGTDPDAWPESERDAGRAALATQPELRLAEDQALDMFLASAKDITPPPDLVSRLMPPAASVSIWARFHNLLLPNGRAWPAGVALASLCIGMVTGYVAPTRQVQIEAPEAYLLTAFQSEPLFDAIEEDTR